MTPGPASDAHDLAATAAAAMPGTVVVRAVAVDALIGRDLRESSRVVATDWRCFGAARHLRELWAQSRDRTIVLVDAAAVGGDALAALRRFAGRVAATEPALVATLRQQLLVPVHLLERGCGAALARLLLLAPGNADDAAARLLEARQWLDRGDQRAAFGAVARSLQLAPDQPGIVADTARLLALLGEADRAVRLCEHFLAQRASAEPVRSALAEIRAHGVRGAVLTPATAVRASAAAASADPRTAPQR